MRVIGLMSGTSYDAIEAAAADLALDGDALLLRPLGHLSVPYPDGLRDDIAAALPPAHTTTRAVCALDTGIGQAFAGAAGRALRDLCAGTADLVVSHGQTMHHWVEDGTVRGTLQLGRPAWIAEATGLPVVSDLRSRDVAAGGQGAPLVALTDALLLSGLPGTPAALNLGGIANITVLAPGAEPLAFDTGPANALLDAAVRHFTDGAAAYDEDGRRAGAGQVSPELLRVLLADPYYRRPAPKTTGKEHFHLPYLRRALDTVPVPSTADVLATLTRLTAVTVADACRAHGVTRLVVSGGGTRNPVLMRMLAEELPGVPLGPSDDLGLSSAAKEALAFAVLGFLTAHGLPGALPSGTGARHATVLGSITPGRTPLRLPEPAARPPRLLRILR
ncbi:anhydro-N-acetylmuramic acid kinase [Streptomyces rubradiris]|uniref:Anhydro-N-acetylmuramic acid kinase n=1 Tax=Streptomyces rubradiris TaxID=285531 RepID=A0ABQ3R9E5_STRRR|nr:anhydro-N-acetylmuramic acid kinase [Streptomyces rubradiris]GHG99909.1 anhydro-N-acetylmuramic acid kinase [Streptomyces rubradiris]GHI52470.1 anhydro-N-acetylmuramic acid kinase [Streptomyces rubradiris]